MSFLILFSACWFNVLLSLTCYTYLYMLYVFVWVAFVIHVVCLKAFFRALVLSWCMFVYCLSVVVYVRYFSCACFCWVVFVWVVFVLHVVCLGGCSMCISFWAFLFLFLSYRVWLFAPCFCRRATALPMHGNPAWLLQSKPNTSNKPFCLVYIALCCLRLCFIHVLKFCGACLLF